MWSIDRRSIEFPGLTFYEIWTFEEQPFDESTTNYWTWTTWNFINVYVDFIGSLESFALDASQISRWWCASTPNIRKMLRFHIFLHWNPIDIDWNGIASSFANFSYRRHRSCLVRTVKVVNLDSTCHVFSRRRTVRKSRRNAIAEFEVQKTCSC